MPALLQGQPSTSHSLKPVPIQQVSVDDGFWAPRFKTWRTVTIPDCFAKFEKDGAFANFDKIRDGTGGDHAGPPWYDGLIYEMIRGSADFLAGQPDPALEAQLDSYIERIAAAASKDPDGYLNTYTQLKEPNHRWGLNGGNNRWQHDLYNAGAMVEAAVHYYQATGKTRLLATATRLANHMCDVMGPPPRKNVVPGHSLGEEALVKLYLLFREHPELKDRMGVPVEETRYLRLAEFWIENRGRHEGRESYGAYGQDHQPVLEQKTIEGHAVRATLLCAGLSAAAMVNGREDYLQAAQRLWNSMVDRRMYVIGGLGAIAGHEGFGPDYLLPNNGYLETCAAIGAAFFHQNMNLALADGRYADELERVLYNGILSGVSLKGDSYFYENPLEADSKRSRWAWHSCPCCPPMFLKMMGALPGYIYAQDHQDIYVSQFIGSRARVTIANSQVGLSQVTSYPWKGDIRLDVDPKQPAEFGINVRVPTWCPNPRLTVNGKAVRLVPIQGYARVRRLWKAGDTIHLSLPMPVQRLLANSRVDASRGMVALQRGPLVYCVEAADNAAPVRQLALPAESSLKAKFEPDLLGGVTVIRGACLAQEPWPDTLYLSADRLPEARPAKFVAIPYFANANRAPGDMTVWLPEVPIKR